MEISYDSETRELTPGYIQRLEYRMSVDDLDSIEVRLQMTSDGNIAETKKMLPGTEFKLKIDDLDVEGDIVNLRFHQTKEGIDVTVYGLETLHRLRHQRLSEIKEQTLDKVVETLLTAATVKGSKVGKVKPTAAEQVSLDDDSVKLLKRLCAERNFALYWSNGKLEYGPRNVSTGGAAIKIDSSLLTSVELELDLSEVVTSLTLHGRDYRKAAEELTFTASGSKLKKISKGTPATTLRLQGFGKLEQELPWNLAFSTASALEEAAVAELQARAEKFAKGRCVGELNVDILPLCLLELENLPWPLTGPYLVSEVSHLIEDGQHETTVEFFSDSLAKE